MSEDYNRSNDENRSKLATDDGYDIGTFHFLKVGWWVWHVIAIVAVFYLGYAYGASIF